MPLFVGHGARIILIQPVDLTDIEIWEQAYRSRIIAKGTTDPRVEFILPK